MKGKEQWHVQTTCASRYSGSRCRDYPAASPRYPTLSKNAINVGSICIGAPCGLARKQCRERDKTMSIGLIILYVVIAVLVILAVIVFVSVLPDIRRYLRMRSM